MYVVLLILIKRYDFRRALINERLSHNFLALFFEMQTDSSSMLVHSLFLPPTENSYQDHSKSLLIISLNSSNDRNVFLARNRIRDSDYVVHE